MAVVIDQTKATVIAHSKCINTGKEIVTFELEFPRPVLAEFNTHNALSKNASSSRAIPVPTMLKQVRHEPAFLVRYGAANTGMQDNGDHNGLVTLRHFAHAEFTPHGAWAKAAQVAADFAEDFHNAGYAKQVCNRLIEPFQMMKVVMTATELNNFIWLRDHHMADPTIAALARKIKAAFEASVPVVLRPGDWHVPYYNSGQWIAYMEDEIIGTGKKIVTDKFGHSLEHALVISSSCSAQVSYRKLDDTIEKARGVVARLNLQGEEPDQPVHASPLEHQATPIAESEKLLQMNPMPENFDACAPTFTVGKVNVFGRPDTWQEGITHMDRDGTLCSGNLKGFIQHRQLVPNHVKRG